MDEISQYIVQNADQLMNDLERRAYSAFLLKQKAEAAQATKLAKYFDDPSLEEPRVSELLKLGFDGFIESVRERVIRENVDKNYLNYCPRCGGLTRTPTARQCQKCFFSWHEQS